MAGIGIPSFEKRFARLVRDVEILGGRINRARVPLNITSTARPDPLRLQPGVPLFETDTNRTVYVNADQTGFVNALGAAV